MRRGRVANELEEQANARIEADAGGRHALILLAQESGELDLPLADACSDTASDPTI